MTLSDFLTGSGTYDVERSSGPPRLVVPVTLAILALSQVLTAALFSMLGLVDHARISPAPGGIAEQTNFFMLFSLVSQSAIVALTLAAALRPGILPALKLQPPSGGARVYFYALAAMVPLVAAFNAAAYLLAPDMMAQDFKVFRDLARSGALLTTALVIGAGAPLSEEFLFRGYLLSSLVSPSRSFLPCAMIATGGWTLLHLNYSWVGLAEVFLIGLYFSWLLWRTGSLLPALLCHAVYNSCLLAVLRIWPG